MKSLAFPIILFVLSLNARGTEIILHNATDLINLSNNVSSGSVYSGTTILLDSDIDFDGFSDIFEPIGKDSSHYFNGTFDGQGHIIKNLAMNSTTLSDVGFVGWVLSATIKNIVFDSSCSFISYETPNINVGKLGPISYFKGSGNGECIENIVNMASISFTSSGANYAVAGGIIGKTDAYSCIRNCVNYGKITITGSANYVFVGGIVGDSVGDKSASTNNVIRSCINYGYISNSISGSYVFVGGIVGYTEKYFLIDSCVGAGEISSPSNSKVGGIIGTTYDTSNVRCIMNNSYWTGDISGYNKHFSYATGIKSTNSESVDEMDETVLDKLNGGSSSSSGDESVIWLLNSNGKTVTFFVNDKVYFSSTSPMILMPSFDKDDFDGWYTDKARTTLLASLTVMSDADFYGIYKSQVTVMFDANGGNLFDSVSSSITVIYSEEYGGLPGATRTEHRFDGWFTAPVGGIKITAYSIVTDSESHTLYAHWTPNNYTVTFDFANGTTLNSTFGYNQPIDYPENETLIREGYSFNGWDKGIILMPAQNITITAYWIEIVQSSSSSSSSTVNHIFLSSSSSSSIVNPIESSSSNNSSILINTIESSSSFATTDSSKVGYEYVEIVFGNKDLSKEDVERIVSSYTNDSFIIERIETDDDNTIRVIIKFTDVERAESFIETIKNASDSNINIVSVGYFLPEILSFSPSIVPFISAFLISLYFIY